MSLLRDFYKTWFETQENKKITGLVGMIIITIMLAGVFSYEASAIDVVDEQTLKELAQNIGGQASQSLREVIDNNQESGYTQENSYTDVPFKITEAHSKLTWVNCTLIWQDEASQFFQGTNEPDNFKVSILGPDEKVLAESNMKSVGPVSASLRLDYTEEDFVDNYIGDWNIRVEAGPCGDDEAFVPLLGLRTSPDNGNDWNLDYSFTYLEYEE
jgi:hypothetical protein